MLQLQQQAFAQIAGEDASRIKLLQPVQYGHHLVFFDVQFRVHAFQHVFNGGVQITIIIDAIDQHEGDITVCIGHWCQIQLPQQVILQAVGGCMAGIVIEIIVDGAAVAGSNTGGCLVGVFPLTVDREIVR